MMRLPSHGNRTEAAERLDRIITAGLVLAAVAMAAGLVGAVAHNGTWVLRPVLALVALSLAFTRLTRGFVAMLCLVAGGYLLHG